MKSKFIYSLTCIGLILLIAITGCNKASTSTSAPATYQQVNLVADSAGYGTARIDPYLNNAWGIAIGPTGALWIASNHKGLSTVYDRNGIQLMTPVNIPLGLNANGSSPAGVVYNTTSSFIIPLTAQVSKFIFSTEDGIISAWSSGTSAITVVDKSASGKVYKGIAMATSGTSNYVYATDFHNGKVDAFDGAFYSVGMPFLDPTIPAGFAPFNIQNIAGQLYVTYAMQKSPDKHDDQSGVGNGYVSIFNYDGTFVRRFASQGTLNSPWGIVQAPSGFGLGSNDILVANFGDGRINIFDANGNYQGQLMAGTSPLSIDGLWDITFPQNSIPAGDPNQLFFTAGPQHENHGLFGYIKKN